MASDLGPHCLIVCPCPFHGTISINWIKNLDIHVAEDIVYRVKSAV